MTKRLNAVSLTLVLLGATLYTSIAFATDLNGYTALYECRAGNVNCDVDIGRLTAMTCDHVITTNDQDWSKITNNTSASVFCITNGDHSAKGALTLRFSGSSSARKVIRYTRSGDNDDHPWHQSQPDRAIVKQLTIDSARFWLIHRISLTTTPSPSDGYWNVGTRNGATDNIINRVLVENAMPDGSAVEFGDFSHRNALQNSVIRNGVLAGPPKGGLGIGVSGSNEVFVVNNEIYDVNEHGFMTYSTWRSSGGTVVENNDIYASTARYSDCNGNINLIGPCYAGENPFVLKSGGEAGAPLRVIHNRIWGARWADSNVCCQGDNGQLMAIYSQNASDTNTKYVLIQNNILGDAQMGLSAWAENAPAAGRNISVIGNIFYDIRDQRRAMGQSARDTGGLMAWGFIPDSEIYLNTFINVEGPWMDVGGNLGAYDVRCNVVVNSGNRSGTLAPSTVISDNVIYASSSDARNTQYCYWRKLQTAPERICIDNSKPSTASPHYAKCPTDVGMRPGSGINDLSVF